VRQCTSGSLHVSAPAAKKLLKNFGLGLYTEKYLANLINVYSWTVAHASCLPQIIRYRFFQKVA
jgi:hypothetical protein